MIERLKALMGGRRRAAPAPAAEAPRFAAAALLVEAALMDAEYGDGERDAIHDMAVTRFGLSQAEAAELLRAAEAEMRASVQLHPYTRAVKDGFSYDERVDLIEMLWEVAYADGELHDYEANLIRRVAGLIYVTDRDRGDAHKRVIAKRGASRAPDTR